MKPSTVHRRREQTIRQAVISVYNGMSVRKAAAAYRLPKSTVHHAFYAPMKPRVLPRHKRALSDFEENQIVSLLLKYADKGVPLTCRHVEEAVSIIVQGMTVSRRIALPFTNAKPGPKFFRGFLNRHKDELHFVKPLKQEHDRFKALNAETLCEHFATLEKLVFEYDLDATRIWNLDECGVTPGRDANGRSQRKRILRRNGGRNVRVMPFSYDKRITFMPVISAAADAGPCLFVFKGKTFPYRTVLINGKEKIETIADHLPRGAVATMREQGGGVDKDNFLEWAYHFVVSVKDLTRNGRKVLLIYDGYRSHMSLQVLRLFADSNVVVYALPSHFSGKTQPLDVVAFASFKRNLNERVYESTGRFFENGATLFELCDIITTAYNHTFTPSIILSSFMRSGIWPLDSAKLMNTPRPADESLMTVVDVEHMECMMEQRRNELSTQVFGERVTVLEKGYIDTRKGAVLTSDAALELVQKRVDAQREARLQAGIDRERRLLRAALKEKKDKADALRLREKANVRRARLAGMDLGVYKRQVRPLKERRALARLRNAQNNGQVAE